LRGILFDFLSSSTDKGKMLFASVKDKLEIKNHHLSDIVPLQPYGKKHKFDINMRRYTLDLLSSEISLKEIIKYC